MEKIMTTYKEYDHCMYHIYAYRKLTKPECKQAIADYMKLPEHEWPDAGKIIEIDTEI